MGSIVSELYCLHPLIVGYGAMNLGILEVQAPRRWVLLCILASCLGATEEAWNVDPQTDRSKDIEIDTDIDIDIIDIERGRDRDVAVGVDADVDADGDVDSQIDR